MLSSSRRKRSGCSDCSRKKHKCRLLYGGCLNCKKGKRKLEKQIMKFALDINKLHKKKLIGSGIASKLYKTVANVYRRAFCPNSRPLLDNELHPICANYTGPHTRIDIPYIRNYPPSSPVDDCSRDHDIEYDRIKHLNVSKSEKARLIQKADSKAVGCYQERYDTDPTLAKLGIAGLSGKLTVESLLSLLKGTPSVIYGGRKKKSYKKKKGKKSKQSQSMRNKYRKKLNK